MDKQINALKKCMKDQCKVEQSSATILSEMDVLYKRMTAGDKVTDQDIAELRKISKKVRDFKVKSENMKCMADECMSEYAALTRANMKNVAAKLDKAAALMEGVMAQDPGKTRPKKKSSSKTASAKKRS